MFKDKERIMHLRTMPYADYLKTPEWARKRDSALLRDGHRCRACNSNEHLEVHHRTYARRGNEDMNDLTTLCAECHEHFHQKIDQQYLMATTYTAPIAPRTPEERRIEWEECLIGLLLCTFDQPGASLRGRIQFYARGILSESDFVGKDTWALYQILSNEQTIPAEYQSVAERIRNETEKDLPTDEQDLVKVMMTVLTRLKRFALLQENTALQKQIHAASESGDKEAKQHLQERLRSVHQQLRTLESGIQGGQR